MPSWSLKKTSDGATSLKAVRLVCAPTSELDSRTPTSSSPSGDLGLGVLDLTAEVKQCCVALSGPAHQRRLGRACPDRSGPHHLGPGAVLHLRAAQTRTQTDAQPPPTRHLPPRPDRTPPFLRLGPELPWATGLATAFQPARRRTLARLTPTSPVRPPPGPSDNTHPARQPGQPHAQPPQLDQTPSRTR